MEAGKLKLNGYEFEPQKISDLVEKFESMTSAEIVPHVVPQSDLYPASSLRIMISLFFTEIFFLWFLDFELTLTFIMGFIVSSIILGKLLDLIPFVKRLFISRDEVLEEVNQKALEVFFNRGLHLTDRRSGVLLFVSLLEHRIEIICDKTVNEKIDKDQWDACIKDMGAFLKKHNLHAALDSGVQNIGTLLSSHLPCDGSSSNEIENEIIVEE